MKGGVKMFNNNKKAQNLSISTIILIILGVVVLVALIVGFSKGWNNMLPWIAPSDNAQAIIAQCASACVTGNLASWCEIRDFNQKGKEEPIKGDCNYFSSSIGVSECATMDPCSKSETTPKCVGNSEIFDGNGIVCDRKSDLECVGTPADGTFQDAPNGFCCDRREEVGGNPCQALTENN